LLLICYTWTRLGYSLYIELLTCNFPIMREALPRWTATASRWRKNDVDRGSWLTSESRRPISQTSSVHADPMCAGELLSYLHGTVCWRVPILPSLDCVLESYISSWYCVLASSYHIFMGLYAGEFLSYLLGTVCWRAILYLHGTVCWGVPILPSLDCMLESYISSWDCVLASYYPIVNIELSSGLCYIIMQLMSLVNVGNQLFSGCVY